MRYIKLKGLGGKYSAIVDDDDYEWLSKMQWHAAKVRHYISVRTRLTKVLDDGFTWWRAETMHRTILGRTTPLQTDVFVDHINGNTLDNRKENLRTCSSTENIRNSVKRRTHNGHKPSSKYKGVMWYPWNNQEKNGKPWNAQIRFNKKLHNLGYFATEEDAAHAYDEAARKYFGEFARMNLESGIMDGRKVKDAS